MLVNSKIIHATAHRQAGLSLVELMVALVLSLMLMTGVITVFQANKTTFKTQSGLAEVQESGRIALLLLARDIRNTGYWGCGNRSVKITNTLNNSSSYFWNIDRHIHGFNAASSSWSPTVDSTITALSPSPTSGSDIFTLRFASGDDVRVINHNSNAAALHATPYADFEDDDILMVTNCKNAAVFQATNIQNDAVAKTTIVHNSGGSTTPGNSTKDLGNTYLDAEVMKWSTKVFFVSTGSYTGAQPGLWVSENGDSPEELVPGVQQLQVLYGEDSSGDLGSDNYVTANNVTNWENVVSVRINLLVASLSDNVIDEPQTYTFDGTTVTPTDRRLRQAFTSTIAIRNRTP